MAIFLSVSSWCIHHQRGRGAFIAGAEGFSHSGDRWLRADCKTAAFRGHFGEALRTADGGDIRPKVHVLPNVFLQLAAFIAAIQHTDLQRPVAPLFERIHVSNPRVDLRRRRR